MQYSNSEAVIELIEVNSWKAIPVDFQYDSNTGSYSLKGVPPGEYYAMVRIESGYPFDIESGGDFTSRLSGLNPNIIVTDDKQELQIDLAVIYHVHLLKPVDNQQRTKATTDPYDVLYKPSGATHTFAFEWEPVPDAVSYRLNIMLVNRSPNQTQANINETLSATSFYTDLAVTTGDEYYQFSVTPYDSDEKLLGMFSYYYTNGSGGWYRFKVEEN